MPFAIQLTEENMPKILEDIGSPAQDKFNYSLFMNHPSMFYAVTGFVDQRGKYQGFAVQPAYVIDRKYDIADAEQIKNDWTMIVRL